MARNNQITYCKHCGNELKKTNTSGICKECSNKIKLENKILRDTELYTCECGRDKRLEDKCIPNTTFNGEKTLCPYCAAKAQRGRYAALHSTISKYFYNKDRLDSLNLLDGACENLMNIIMYISNVASYKLSIKELILFAKIHQSKTKEKLTGEHINGRTNVSRKLILYICEKHSDLLYNNYEINDSILDKFINIVVEYLLRYCITIPTSKKFNQQIKLYQNIKDNNGNNISISYDIYIRELEIMLAEYDIILSQESKDIIKKYMY